MKKVETINIIGAGLAGCECAYILANNGFKVNLYEMKPKYKSPAHKSNMFAELVCSNSLKSEAITNATGMIPARKSVNVNYPAGSPEYVLYQQLLKTGKARPDTVGYPKFTTIFNQIISELKDGNVGSILNTKTQALQQELDRLSRR